MLRIASGFQLPAFMDFDRLDSLPVHVHKYGDPQPHQLTFHWMQYRNANGYTGTLSFARFVGLHWPEFAQYVADYLNPLFDGVSIDPQRVAFMKTWGDTAPHRDEGGRLSCINIGLRNCDAAVTRFSIGNDFDRFETDYEDFQVETGSTYILDVSNVHAVVAKDMRERLLVTYGFSVPAKELVNRLKRQ